MIFSLKRSQFGSLLVVAFSFGTSLCAQIATPTQTPTSTTTKAEGISWTQLNDIFGIQLWQDDYLWRNDASETARRLKWPQESVTSETSSFRRYTAPDYKVLGTHPFSIALYATGGKIASLSFVFANKGDMPGNYFAAISHDKQILVNKLDSAFGKSERGRFGEGSYANQERVKRWNWKGHAFLISAPSGEYVILRILPTEIADSEGRSEKANPGAILNELSRNVQKRDNGDVVVADIPMVEQGPKGYCVPATWERYLRYLGANADMYVLAMAGHSSTKYGTYFNAMATYANSILSEKGIRGSMIPSAVTVSTVSKSIDKGIPLMWGCFVDLNTETIVTERTNERKRVTDWSQWPKQLLEWKKRKLRGVAPRGNNGGHMRMIIGYNPKTKEISISDSWGPYAAERWITEEEAGAMSQGGLFYLAN